MADNNLPEPTPAPNDTPPAPTPPAPSSEPAPKPADGKPTSASTPVNPLDQLTEDEKTYLKGQKIEGLDLSNGPDAIRKIINHAQASQRQLSKLNDQFNKAGLTLKPDEPVNPLMPPGASDQPQPDNGNPKPSDSGGLDPVQAFTLSNQLVQNFPHLKEDLTSGKFYQDMQTMGVPLKVNGQINLSGLLSYGKLVNDQREMEAKLAEASKPGEGAIPDANPTTPQQPADDAPMTKQIAQAIALHVSKGGTHARAEEAKQFLQKNVGAK